ncbi:jg6060 [Pararge aegeria aegeria]|uniref:Jg6060 protein n=1 Tax=Pararge aegeria aegeria TaxID=348720 RepID=A0A8S4RCI8_9NEOP|nr:jg6060 [Pararge aegeria aegeria]
MITYFVGMLDITIQKLPIQPPDVTFLAVPYLAWGRGFALPCQARGRGYSSPWRSSKYLRTPLCGTI